MAVWFPVLPLLYADDGNGNGRVPRQQAVQTFALERDSGTLAAHGAGSAGTALRRGA